MTTGSVKKQQAARASTAGLEAKNAIKDTDKAERIRHLASKQFDAELDDLEALFNETRDLTSDDPKFLARYYYGHRAKQAGLNTVMKLAKLAGAAPTSAKQTSADLIAAVTSRVNKRDIDQHAAASALNEIKSAPKDD